MLRHVGVSSTKRLRRGIEIAEFLVLHPDTIKKRSLPFCPFYIGIDIETSARIEAIGTRLLQRMDDGLIQEVESLLSTGLSHERLQQLGLEYKFVSLYLQNKLGREEMISELKTAIIQYAKRQMTWFRKMEKEGIVIHWIKKDRDIRELSQELKAKFTAANG